ncbi:NUDIX hydrolase [Xanthobacteraceae bacterium A53D]
MIDAPASDGVFPVSRLDLRVEPGIWTEAEAHRPEIDAHFARRKAETPQIWNGRVLVMRHLALDGDLLRGRFIEVDFASFLWWRDHGWQPQFNVYNAFGAAALEDSDGAFLLGVMGDWTAAAGKIYFPCGTPDLSDVTPEGAVDFEASMRRELTEETGLTFADVAQDKGWTLVLDQRRVAVLRRLVTREAARPLAARVRAGLGAQAHPELSDMRVIAGPADITPDVMPFAATYMRHVWGARA